MGWFVSSEDKQTSNATSGKYLLKKKVFCASLLLKMNLGINFLFGF